MKIHEVRWNEEARKKILVDADHALQEALRNASNSLPESNRNEVYESVFKELEGQFVDFEPGPDLGDYVDALVEGKLSFDDERPD